MIDYGELPQGEYLDFRFDFGSAKERNALILEHVADYAHSDNAVGIAYADRMQTALVKHCIESGIPLHFQRERPPFTSKKNTRFWTDLIAATLLVTFLTLLDARLALVVIAAFLLRYFLRSLLR